MKPITPKALRKFIVHQVAPFCIPLEIKPSVQALLNGVPIELSVDLFTEGEYPLEYDDLAEYLADDVLFKPEVILYVNSGISYSASDSISFSITAESATEESCDLTCSISLQLVPSEIPKTVTGTN